MKVEERARIADEVVNGYVKIIAKRNTPQGFISWYWECPLGCYTQYRIGGPNTAGVQANVLAHLAAQHHKILNSPLYFGYDLRKLDETPDTNS